MYNYKVDDKEFDNLNDAIVYRELIIMYVFDNEDADFGNIIEIDENGNKRVMYEIG